MLRKDKQKVVQVLATKGRSLVKGNGDCLCPGFDWFLKGFLHLLGGNKYIKKHEKLDWCKVQNEYREGRIADQPENWKDLHKANNRQ